MCGVTTRFEDTAQTSPNESNHELPVHAAEDPDADAQVYDKLHSTWVFVYTGDWIIKGIRGEFYPCRPDVFAESYEPDGGAV
jgi:hypothetical protein